MRTKKFIHFFKRWVQFCVGAIPHLPFYTGDSKNYTKYKKGAYRIYQTMLLRSLYNQFASKS